MSTQKWAKCIDLAKSLQTGLDQRSSLFWYKFRIEEKKFYNPESKMSGVKTSAGRARSGKKLLAPHLLF